MPASEFIERARRASDHIKQVREQVSAGAETIVSSSDELVTVTIGISGKPVISIDPGRAYSYEEPQIVRAVMVTYNRALRAHTERMQETAQQVSEALAGLVNGKER